MIARAAASDLLPRHAGPRWPGVTLSVLAHGALLAALAWGVSWQSPSPQAVSAELWAAVPQSAAPAAAPPAPAAEPPATPPPPAPRATAAAAELPDAAQIALERARKLRDQRAREAEARAQAEKARRDQEERDRREREARDKEREQKARAEAERRDKASTELRERQRKETLDRMMGQLGGSGSGTRPSEGAVAGAGGAPSASYAGRLIAAIKPNIVFTDTPAGNPAAEVDVRAGPGGTILGRTLVRSSGNKEWDEAVLRAIDRTGTLPRDVDGRVPSRLTITFRPRD